MLSSCDTFSHFLASHLMKIDFVSTSILAEQEPRQILHLTGKTMDKLALQ